LLVGTWFRGAKKYNAMIGLFVHFYYFLAFFLLFIFTFKVYHFSIETTPSCTTTLDFGFSQGRIASELWCVEGIFEHKLDGRNSVFAKMPPCRVCRFVGPSHSYGEKLQNVISCHTHAPS
jgi:hypothetical protein